MNPVYFYWPNLIGYSRILFLFLAGYYYHAYGNSAAFLSTFFYCLSMGLDAIDGTVARMFNQTSSFGAQLDMLTDRMTTTALYVVLAKMYPLHWYLSALAIMVDIVSHWLHMMSKLEAGNRSHKTARNAFLAIYYNFPYFMLTLCVGQELFLLIYFIQPQLLLQSSPPPPSNGSNGSNGSSNSSSLLWVHSMLFSAPVWYTLLILYLLKQYANVVQLVEACDFYASRDMVASNSKGNNNNSSVGNKSNSNSNSGHSDTAGQGI